MATVSGRVFKSDGGSVYPQAQHMRWYRPCAGNVWRKVVEFQTNAYGKYGPVSMQAGRYRVAINGDLQTCPADPREVAIEEPSTEQDFRRTCPAEADPPGKGTAQCACAKPPRTKRKLAKK